LQIRRQRIQCVLISRFTRVRFVFAKLLQFAGAGILVLALLHGLGLTSSGEARVVQQVFLMLVGGAVLFAGVILERNKPAS
jgi:hypothetical protein